MGSTKASKGHGAREAPRHKSAAKGTWVGHLFKKLLGLNPKPQAEEWNGFVLDNWGRPVPECGKGNMPSLFFYSECRRTEGTLYDVAPFNPAIHSHLYLAGNGRA